MNEYKEHCWVTIPDGCRLIGLGDAIFDTDRLELPNGLQAESQGRRGIVLYRGDDIVSEQYDIGFTQFVKENLPDWSFEETQEYGYDYAIKYKGKIYFSYSQCSRDIVCYGIMEDKIQDEIAANAETG